MEVTVSSEVAGLYTNQPQVLVEAVLSTTEEVTATFIDDVSAPFDASGRFSRTVTLEEGENVITAKAFYAEGRYSASDSLTIILDTTPPELEVTSPDARSVLPTPCH